MDLSRLTRKCAALCIVLLSTLPAKAQDAPTFQNFFFEGSQHGSVYGDLGLVFTDFDNVDILFFGGTIGIPLGDVFELGIMVDFTNIDPAFGNNASGLTDPLLVGRYLLQEGQTDISVGAGLTLPIGEEEVGGGESVDINLFGALRHHINAVLAIKGVLGIDFVEQFNEEYDASLRLGGAVIYRTTPNLQLIGELNILSDTDFALLNFGVDYQISSSARLRPAIGIGVDNGAPDFALALRLLLE